MEEEEESKVTLGLKTYRFLLFLLILALFTVPPAHPYSSLLAITVATGKPSYAPGEGIEIYGTLLWNGSPVEGLLALQVDNPDFSPRVLRTPATGLAAEAGSIEIVEFYPSDSNRLPKDTFNKGELAHFTITINNTASSSVNVLIGAVNAYDSASFSLGLSVGLEIEVPAGDLTSTFSLLIPTWASTGIATAYTNAYTTWPSDGGTPYGPEMSTTFTIIDAATQGVASQQPEQTMTDAAFGNYNLTFKLSAEEKSGNWTVYVSSRYQGESASNSTTFDLTPPTQHSLTISTTAGGTTDPPPGSYVYNEGANVTVAAIPANGYAFDNWELDGVNAGSANPISIIMDANYTLKAFFSMPVHDIAVTAVTAHPKTVVRGDLVSINVTVANEGHFTEVFNVTAYYDGTLIGTELDVPLDQGASANVSLLWDTTPVAVGIYTIRANCTVITGETDTADNVRISDDLVTVVLTPFHDIAVTSVTASPSEVIVGNPVSIDVITLNEGTYTEVFNVSIYYDTSLIETRTDIPLEAGASTTVSFNWITTTTGTFTISAKAQQVAGEIDTDDNELSDGTVTVSPLLVHDVAVTGVSAPDQAYQGDIITVGVDLANTGDSDETFNLVLTYDLTLIGTKPVTLTSKDSTSVSFSWDTSGVTPGTYTITAEAIIAIDDNSTNNKATAQIEVLSPQHSLTISTTAGGTTDPPPGSYSYNEDTIVVVSAVPYDGYVFDHWELDGVNKGNPNPISVTMDAPHTLRAVFSTAPQFPGIPLYAVATAAAIIIIITALVIYFIRIRKPKENSSQLVSREP